MTCTVGLRALLVTCTSLAEESFKSGAWMHFGSVEQTAGVGWKGDGQTRDMPTLLDNSQYIAMAPFFFARHIFLLFYWYFINAECNCSKVLKQHNFNIITSLCIWKLNFCTSQQVENLLCFWPPSSRDCSHNSEPTHPSHHVRAHDCFVAHACTLSKPQQAHTLRHLYSSQ